MGLSLDRRLYTPGNWKYIEDAPNKMVLWNAGGESGVERDAKYRLLCIGEINCGLLVQRKCVSRW